MQAEPSVSNSTASARLLIRGRVEAAAFAPWIERCIGRLGLRGGVLAVRPGEVEVFVEGQAALIDALEVSCSLGPIEVLVDGIRRDPPAR